MLSLFEVEISPVTALNTQEKSLQSNRKKAYNERFPTFAIDWGIILNSKMTIRNFQTTTYCTYVDTYTNPKNMHFASYNYTLVARRWVTGYIKFVGESKKRFSVTKHV